MTVDLSKLKIGDKVKYDNGRISVVENVTIRDALKYDYPVRIKTDLYGIDSYTFNGSYTGKLGFSGYDIVEIIPKKVKQ